MNSIKNCLKIVVCKLRKHQYNYVILQDIKLHRLLCVPSSQFKVRIFPDSLSVVVADKSH